VQPCLRTLIVIPAYNEQGKVGAVIHKIPRGIDAAVVVADDCSKDETSAEARVAGGVVIRHERNTGVGGAIRSGIDYARRNGYGVIAILLGDDQHDPDDLHGFVQGSRRLSGLQAPNIGWFRRIFTWVYTVIFRWFTGFPCTERKGEFMVIGRMAPKDFLTRHLELNGLQE
jgi:glycosyltransferase involved in cell wall biosynthesis